MEILTQPGYKHTELGWIPEEWEAKEFGDICTPSKSKFNPLVSESKPCLELEDLAQNTGRLLGISDSKDKVSLKTVFNNGDVLLGKLRPYLRKYYYSEFDGVCSTEIWALKSKFGIDSKFLFFQAQSDRVIEAANLSTGTKMPRAEWKTVSQTKISLPPFPEQQAIATALSDMDAYIRSLEQLIEKKKAIKQAAMQELLTPKEDWEVRKFGEVVERFIDYRGVTPKKLGMDWGGGEIPALSANNVQMGFVDFDKECYYGSEMLYKKWMRNGDCEKHDILMTLEAPLGNIAFVPDNKKYILSQRTILIRPKNILDKVFLRYILSNQNFQNQLFENASGSTAQGIQRKKLEQLLVFFPKKIDQQIEISQSLLDLDKNISALGEKLLKVSTLKQAMMQDLLTGKVRLV